MEKIPIRKEIQFFKFSVIRWCFHFSLFRTKNIFIILYTVQQFLHF